ncbi:MAG: hypothetical protein ABUL62_09630 [Myxococcales bacterium]|jgi:hypothetical protein
MKRSLTIGCVLLVGGGVTHCGGSAETGAVVHDDPTAGYTAAGAGGALIGILVDPNAGGVDSAGGGFVGLVDGHYGGAPGAGGTGPYIGEAGAPDALGSGAPGWDMGGESGASNEPPAVGTAPLGGAGGFVGVPPK